MEVVRNTNTYILNLEAAYIYKDICEHKNTSIKNKDRDKIYTATMPLSLETNRAKEYYEDEYFKLDNKEYTNLFVNVNFNKDYFIKDIEDRRKIIAKKNEIRKKLYVDGFVLDDEHYVFFKRSSGKAKLGSAIFVKKYAKDKLINRGNLGVQFNLNEEVDLTSIHAYQSLIMSSIDFTIDINADEILIIDDIYGKKFMSWASVTEIVEGKLKTHNKKIMLNNCLSDGQGFLDESVFAEYNEKNKGFMLLRSDWLKSCAFNTKLRDFWRENDVEQIVEKLNGIDTGRILDTSKIKLVITPNSLKWLKLTQSKFDGDVIKCYLYWLDNIDSIFGVVKTDKQGNFGTYNRTTYQLLNSLPLDKKDIEIIAKTEIDYARSLKDDFTIFRNYIGSNIKNIKDLESDMDYVENYRPEAILVEDKYKTVDLLNNLLLINSDFQYTHKFKEYKKTQIEYYINNLRKGKIRLKDTIYATIISNPYEMLLSTIGRYVEGVAIASNREVYCKFYHDKYSEFCISRNPHINSGNVMYSKMKWHDEYKWFNLTDNIVIMNFNDNDSPQRLQGCDTDSDTILMLPNSTLVNKSKECEKLYYTPINMVEGDKKRRFNNMIELAELDNVLSNNFIGKIVNKSQIINSYMWDCVKKKKDKELIDILYNQSSKCSSLSQIEIDKSKKTFDNISMAKELASINNITYNNNPILNFKYYKVIEGNSIEVEKEEYDKIKANNSIINTLNNIESMKNKIHKIKQDKLNSNAGKIKTKHIDRIVDKISNKITSLENGIKNEPIVDLGKIEIFKKMIVPRFFNYVALDNGSRDLINFETPMDYLQDVLDKVLNKKPKRTKTVGFKELLVKQKSLKGVSNTKQIQEIYKIIYTCGKTINGLKPKTCILNDKGKSTVKKNTKSEAIKKLKELKITSNTILYILKQAFGVTKDKYGFKKYSMLTLELLYYSHMFATLNCFKNKDTTKEEILIYDKSGDVNIFGSKYRRTTRGSISNI